MSDNKGGRPRIIESPEEFDERVEEYRQQCRKNDEPLTFTGLAYHLGFASRQSLYDYKEYEGFSDSVKRAQLLVEHEYEKKLSGSSPTGPIFALKNCGWSDRKDVRHSGEIKGAETHIYLPSNSRDDLPTQLQNRQKAIAGNGTNGAGD